MNPIDKTVWLFKEDMNCSQAILTVYGKPFDCDEDMAKKLGRPFGAGMARMALTCGVVTGAIMVLGLAEGNDMDENEAKSHVFGRVQEFVKRFKEKHGHLKCKDLLGADMGTEIGMQKIKEEKLVAKICPGIVRDAAQILESLL